MHMLSKVIISLLVLVIIGAGYFIGYPYLKFTTAKNSCIALLSQSITRSRLNIQSDSPENLVTNYVEQLKKLSVENVTYTSSSQEFSRIATQNKDDKNIA
ncbi:MAG: hypothetical protein ABIP54_00205, partial [Candidatus Andersenbacteria bacterium]